MRLWTAGTIASSKGIIISWKKRQLHLQQYTVCYCWLSQSELLWEQPSAAIFLKLCMKMTQHLIICNPGCSKVYVYILFWNAPSNDTLHEMLCMQSPKTCERLRNKVQVVMRMRSVFKPGGNQKIVGSWDNDDKPALWANNRNSLFYKHRNTSTLCFAWVLWSLFVDIMDAYYSQTFQE